MPSVRLCKADGCENQVTHSGKYCSPACRFWSNFDRSAGPDGCWIWKGTIDKTSGYGVVSGGLTPTKVWDKAHRHAYRLAYGDPGKLHVCHRCDVRACGNPAHLFAGTPRQNWQDAIDKGRPMTAQPGEANAAAKLTAKDVRAIRRSAAKTGALVRQFGVDRKTIRRVLLRETWRHLPDDDPDVIYVVGAMDRPATQPIVAR